MNVFRPRSASTLVLPPDNAERLRRIAETALKRVDTYGVLPTPLDRLMEAQRLGLVADLEDDRESFLASLSSKAQSVARSMFQKLRGVLDVRERKVWVQETPGKPRRSRFPAAHELSHDLLDWHHIDTEFLDSTETLSHTIRATFEREANYTASQLLFQGTRFGERVRDAKESLASALALADEHETTFHSTLWAWVEEQDRPVAVAVYRKNRLLDQNGNSTYRQHEVYASKPFARSYENIELPVRLRASDTWVEGLVGLDPIASGTCRLVCGGTDHGFTWETWTNTFSLFVLVRREPKGAPVTGLIRRVALAVQ